MTAPRNYAPTPWINAVQPVTEDRYKFRIVRTRAFGKLTYEWHRDSPAFPSAVRKIQPGRRGWYEFVQASHRLLHTSEWDPTTDPAVAPARWRTHLQDYGTHQDDIVTVVALLPQLLDPKRHSLRAALQVARDAARTLGGTNTSQVAARTARMREIVEAAARVRAAISEVHEKMQDARRMKGYVKEEVDRMESLTTMIVKAAENLARIARTSSELNAKQFQGHSTNPQRTTVIPENSHYERDARAERAMQAHPVGFHVDLKEADDWPQVVPKIPGPEVPRISIGQEVQPDPEVRLYDVHMSAAVEATLTPEQRAAREEWKEYVREEAIRTGTRNPLEPRSEPEIQVQKPKGFGIVES